MRLGACLVVAALLSVESATAQEPLQDGEYVLEYAPGVIAGTSRIRGLGGAFTALASGVDAIPWNPAAYASRELWENDWFEWEVGLGLSVAVIGNDYFNSGRPLRDVSPDIVFADLGFRMQFADLGIGGLLKVQSLSIPAGPDSAALELVLSTLHAGGGYQLFKGQLVAGVGIRAAIMSAEDAHAVKLISFTGLGLEAGAMLRLGDEPWRLGVAFRSTVRSQIERVNDEASATGLAFPKEVTLPWEVQAGFAYQLGERPLNRKWHKKLRSHKSTTAVLRDCLKLPSDELCPPTMSSEAEAFAALPETEQRAVVDAHLDALRVARDMVRGQYVLISSEVLIQGPTHNATNLEGFVLGSRIVAGDDVTVGVRLGVEAEVIEDWLRIRGGSYLEPSRVQGRSLRPHGTLGFDLKLFTWDLFELVDPFSIRLSTAGDVAKDYLNVGLSIGFWH